MTLSQAYSQTKVAYQYQDSKAQPSVAFTFEGKPQAAFEEKIKKYLSNIQDVFPLVSQLNLKIDSHNTFPHSSGIASSASSMSALAMCLAEIKQSLLGQAQMDLRQASELSRLGSGSASRSIYGPIAIWGKNETVKEGSDKYAIPYSEDIDPIFNDYHDDILIVSKAEKSVSSRAGHTLMIDNPYAQNRFDQAHRHLSEIISAMQSGDLEKFGTIVEKEALTLHALMMASDPPYILMEPETITLVRMIQAYRKETKVPVYLTLDAGPNIHMLYPHAYASKVAELKAELKKHCAEETIIEDQVGTGPKKVNYET